jgi:hypothetical protein
LDDFGILGALRAAGRFGERLPHRCAWKGYPTYGTYYLWRSGAWMALGYRMNPASFSLSRFGAAAGSWIYLLLRCQELLIQADEGEANACDSWLWKFEFQA